jgi:hypothetical protein
LLQLWRTPDSRSERDQILSSDRAANVAQVRRQRNDSITYKRAAASAVGARICAAANGIGDMGSDRWQRECVLIKDLQASHSRLYIC